MGLIVSARAREILGVNPMKEISRADLDRSRRRVVRDGWMLDDGAAVLVRFRKSYFGIRSSFPNIGTYESAVNGRGMPDGNLVESGFDRVPLLLKRGLAFSWQALYAANRDKFGILLVSRVSVAPVMDSPGIHSGYVTFCSAANSREAGVGYAVDDDDFIQIIISSDMATNSLPRR